MKHNKKRIMKIVDEITTHLYWIGAKDINIRIQEVDDKFKITFKSDYLPEKKKKIKKLIDALKRCDKQQEMEEYYWELVGDCDIDNELSLIGMMVDEAELEIEEDHLELILIRYK